MNKFHCDFCGIEIKQSSYSCRAQYYVGIYDNTVFEPTIYDVCKSCQNVFKTETPKFIQLLKNKLAPIVGAPI